MTQLALISVYDTATPERHMYESFLYDLLKERKPWESISHKKVPHYDEHVKFVRSKPYRKWYIIDYKGPVGAIYLTNKNEIGIFIERHNQKRGFGAKALAMLIEDNPDVEYFYANIGAFNSRSLCFFNMKGFTFYEQVWEPALIVEDEQVTKSKLIQYTYRYHNLNYVLPKAHAQSS